MYSYTTNHDTTLVTPIYLSYVQGLEHQWHGLKEPVPEGGCRVYYRASTCSTHYLHDFDGADVVVPECVAFEAAWQLEPLVTAALKPDRVSTMGGLNRHDHPIDIGFYRIVGPAPGETGL